ncbi:2-amino-4-hydroxy-6-hydroxymethyldihydropteridine diphosphokinase [Acuticoccus sp. M5D2P5]|uniref:2-amino-4-hydroxy-6- hydroxymethyldihydropteridine diphosphokinase n=1 Tax=Acuticoccus kalidii TaxID=2910977 RepID=UPI001F3E8AF0|nr:2-amino-4-hydroxy-6-hydroxymethyldihydropteridine diphosphokinase [Acuticoccus kalidii]MCF3933058.1 2-amino-4-hydroxy-6-hydroxymethyldihydropteridine diphosphokinase [Acuticoccus kalidii]
MTSPVRAHIALGSNLGDRAALLDAAVAALDDVPQITVTARSSRHETAAMLPDGAPADWDIPFLNEVVALRTTLAPRALLSRAKAIEASLGRRPAERWAPRLIDIDILSHGDTVIEDGDLVIPHPGIASRLFVLRPWAEIDPDWRHPVMKLTVAEMKNALERP